MFPNVIKYFTEKEKRKMMEIERQVTIDNRAHEITLKRMNLEEKYIESGKIMPENLDKAAMEDMKTSWKDEFIMLILFAPIILSFVPVLQDAVSTGFLILKASLPQWYAYLLVGITTVTFGLRSLIKLVLTQKSKEAKVIVDSNIENKK